jgi:hypothetical protein
MMFIIRADSPTLPAGDIRMTRRTPAIIPGAAGKTDYFCSGDPDKARAEGWTVIPVHDGWYPDDNGGGAAIWGQGLYWEIRDTPFTVLQSATHTTPKAGAADAAPVDVRRAIFGV